MRARTLFRQIAREARGARGRVIFFILCLAVGVGAVVAVAGFSASLRATLAREARQLLAADLRVRGQQPVPAAVDELLAAEAAARSALDPADRDGDRRRGAAGRAPAPVAASSSSSRRSTASSRSTARSRSRRSARSPRSSPTAASSSRRSSWRGSRCASATRSRSAASSSRCAARSSRSPTGSATPSPSGRASSSPARVCARPASSLWAAGSLIGCW